MISKMLCIIIERACQNANCKYIFSPNIILTHLLDVLSTASHCGHRSPFANIKHKNKNEADMEVWRICASNRYEQSFE
jgi:hypothetical protein